MTNVEIKKAANDLAYSTVANNAAEFDAAVAAKAAELGMQDAPYSVFKQNCASARQSFLQSKGQDDSATKRAEVLAARKPETAPANP